METSRLVANIPTQLKRKIKVYAANHETTVTDLIVISLEKLLSQETEDHEESESE